MRRAHTSARPGSASVCASRVDFEYLVAVMPRAVSVGKARSLSGSVGGPRFALRFEDGAGRLVLAKPLRFAFGVVDELELDLGPLRFPLDLSAGAGRFRTRRTRVRAARLRVDVASLLERWVEEPLALWPLALLDEGMSFAMRDAFGTIAFDAAARFEGPKLRIAPARARAVQEGPAPALVRAIVAARSLGFDLEEDRGALVIERPLSLLLTHALVPHGWRVPDDRSLRLELEALGSRRVELRTLAAGQAERRPGRAWERARTLAPVVNHLAAGEREAAARAFASLVERQPDLDGSELGFGAPRGDGPPARCAVLCGALRAGDVEAAARAADALEAAEPCDAVAVEGLCAAADLAMSTRPTLAASLLARACARQPSEARHGLRLIEAATRLSDPAELSRVVESGLAAREPGPDRGGFAREAAALCELAGRSEAADRLWCLAAESLPSDARVLEGSARALERAHDARGALDAYDRAASVFASDGDRSAEASALRRGAAVATGLGDHAAAESRLTRAAQLEGDARTWAALCASRWALGRHDAATRAEDRLLESVQREAHPEDAVVCALEAGARRALGREQLARAKAWCAALVRARPGHLGGAELAAAIEERERAAHAEDPRHLLELDPGPCLDALGRADDPAALLTEALRACEDLGAALRTLRLVPAGPLGSVIVDAVAARVSEVSDGRALLLVAERAVDGDKLGLLLEAALARLREADQPALAAGALARLGVLRRDMTMLRAALTTAEREGAVDVARDIVSMALGVVGQGPARAALEAVLARLGSD